MPNGTALNAGNAPSDSNKAAYYAPMSSQTEKQADQNRWMDTVSHAGLTTAFAGKSS
jgi:hypothetical protein